MPSGPRWPDPPGWDPTPECDRRKATAAASGSPLLIVRLFVVCAVKMAARQAVARLRTRRT